MELAGQKLTIDLPTLLIDGRGQVTMMPPGPEALEAMGPWYLCRGEASVSLSLDAAADDPSRLVAHLVFLEAHYSPPADCPAAARALIHQVNADLSARLLSDAQTDAYL